MEPMENELLAIAMIGRSRKEEQLLRKGKVVNVPVKGYEQFKRAL